MTWRWTMASNEQEGPPQSRPRQTIEQAYQEALDARNLWIEEASSGFPNYSRGQLHAILHAKTMAWWEALHPYLSERDKLEYLWTEVPLWETGYNYVEVLHCAECDEVAQLSDGLDAGSHCPSCEQGVLSKRSTADLDNDIIKTRVHLADDGSYERTYARGLQTLEDYQEQTERTVEVRGTFRKRRRVVERPKRLSPAVLKRVGRLLDQAADKCNLIADVEVEAPQTEVDKDTLAEAKETIEEIVDEYGDEPGYQPPDGGGS